VKEFTTTIPIEKLGMLLLVCFVNIGLGQLEQARRQIDEIVSIGEASGGTNPLPYYLVTRAWAEARLAVAEKRWDAAFTAYETLYNVASRAGMRWHQARTREEWAQSLALRKEPGDLPRAREMMREAITLFEQIKAPQYATRLREKLRKVTG
jgi:hypothetical protein